MSAYDFAAALKADLTADIVLASDLATYFSAPNGWTAIVGNRPTAQIPANQRPCWVIDYQAGSAQPLDNEDGDEGLVIGNAQQSFRAEIGLSLVWTENDRDQAALQRGKLEEIVVRYMLRNPRLGGVVSAWLLGWDSDAGTAHPNHIWAGTLAAEYVISRSQ